MLAPLTQILEPKGLTRTRFKIHYSKGDRFQFVGDRFFINRIFVMFPLERLAILSPSPLAHNFQENYPWTIDKLGIYVIIYIIVRVHTIRRIGMPVATLKICKKCDQPFTAKHKNRKYCGNCRSRESTLSANYKTRIEYKKTCKNCEQEFRTGRSTAKFCTRTCKELARQKRKVRIS